MRCTSCLSKMYTKRVSEHTSACKKRTLDEMLGLFDEPYIQSKNRRYRKCVEPGCTKFSQGKSGKCAKHGGGKLCIEPGCTKYAQGKPGKCIRHGGFNKLCIEPGCTKNAQGKLGKCMKHGGGTKCFSEDGCNNYARGESKMCVKHGGGLRCPECIDEVVSRGGNHYYNGMCAACFKHKFPDDPKSLVMYKRMKELAVRKAINENFEGFIHDKLLYSSCDCPMLRRIDHRTEIDGTLLAIETDEYAHRGYDRKDEVNRYHDIMMSHGGRMLFIRFNPDGRDMSLKKRIEELISEIGTQIRRIKAGDNRELLEVVYKFYPQDRKPCFRD